MSADTPQTLDPLGGLTARHFLWGTAALAAIVPFAMLLAHRGSIENTSVQGLAVLLMLGALALAVIGVDPRYFPFGRARHLVMHAALVGAAALDAASRPDGPAQDVTWGPVCVAIMFVMMGSFRPWGEIAIVAALATIAVGGIVLVHLGDIPPALGADRVLRAIVPILAAGMGASAFSGVLVRRLRAWRAATDPTPAEARTAAAVEVERDRTDLVDYRVGPFLSGLLEAGQLTPTDSARARGLAASVRQQMVRDATRPWLADVVDTVDGDAAAADSMSGDQRRILGAIIAELRSGAPAGTIVAAAVDSSAAPVRLTVTAPVRPRAARATAYRAMLGAVFARCSVEVDADGVTISIVDRVPSRRAD